MDWFLVVGMASSASPNATRFIGAGTTRFPNY